VPIGLIVLELLITIEDQISGFETADVVAAQIDTVGDLMRTIEGWIYESCGHGCGPTKGRLPFGPNFGVAIGSTVMFGWQSTTGCCEGPRPWNGAIKARDFETN
jgi:hypothetical protein